MKGQPLSTLEDQYADRKHQLESRNHQKPIETID